MAPALWRFYRIAAHRLRVVWLPSAGESVHINTQQSKLMFHTHPFDLWPQRMLILGIYRMTSLL